MKPKTIPPMDTEAETRFLQKVERGNNGDCWKWQGSVSNRGYGQFWYRKRAHWAHRLAITLRLGRVRAGYDVHHRCGNTACVNPDHLSLVFHDKHPSIEVLRRNGCEEEVPF